MLDFRETFVKDFFKSFIQQQDKFKNFKPYFKNNEDKKTHEADKKEETKKEGQ